MMNSFHNNGTTVTSIVCVLNTMENKKKYK